MIPEQSQYPEYENEADCLPWTENDPNEEHDDECYFDRKDRNGNDHQETNDLNHLSPPYQQGD